MGRKQKEYEAITKRDKGGGTIVRYWKTSRSSIFPSYSFFFPKPNAFSRTVFGNEKTCDSGTKIAFATVRIIVSLDLIRSSIYD